MFPAPEGTSKPQSQKSEYVTAGPLDPSDGMPAMMQFARLLPLVSPLIPKSVLAPAMTQTMTAGNDPLLTIAIEELDGKCPVCIGNGKCIGCGGDRKTEQGVEAARLDSDETTLRLADLDPQRDRDSSREHFRLVRDFVLRHAGTVEVFDMSALYAVGEDQMDWAAARIDLIREALA